MTAIPSDPCPDCPNGFKLKSHPRCEQCQDTYDLTGASKNPVEETDVYLAMMRQVRLLEEHQKRVLANLQEMDSRQLASELASTAKALSTLGREILNFQRAEMDNIKRMSKEQWAEAIKTWFSKQSKVFQNALLDGLMEIHWDKRKLIAAARKSNE